MRSLALVLSLCSVAVFAERSKPCITPDDAAKLINKDVCINVHVYDVVELPDGTRFMDVCAPDDAG